MKVEYINPFIRALQNTFQTMLGCEIQRGSLCFSQQGVPTHEVSGVIGLSGRAIGTVVLSLSREVALQAASVMLMSETNELDSDVIDAVGELANMVAGSAKAELEELALSISLPTVVVGVDHDVRFPSNVTPICVPFESPWGPLALDVGLTCVPEPAAV